MQQAGSSSAFDDHDAVLRGNIRGFYENFTKRRAVERSNAEATAGPTDYIVLRSYAWLDHLYFQRWNDDLSILVTDLAAFAGYIQTS